MGWSVALCTCNGTLDWDHAVIEGALPAPGTTALYDRLSRDEIHRFAADLSSAGVDHALVACCGAPDRLREAAVAAGIPPEQVVVLNLRETCFWLHPDRAQANAKAARLLRAATLAHETAVRPEIPVSAGPSVLIATDSQAGLDLAARLGQLARPVVVLDPRSAVFDRQPHPLPWPASWGIVADVQGALGNFRVTVQRTQPLDLETCIGCRRCIPVCHTSAITEGLRLRTELCDRCGDCLEACAAVGAIAIPREERRTVPAAQVVFVVDEAEVPVTTPRTGCHVARRPSRADIDALAWTVFGLIGEFRQPRYVGYDATTCAGGAAGRQACGRCITACPYAAIARDPRDPLRVRVDAAACEGCGACVSACPTSALTFTAPPPAVLRARLAGLLAPLHSGAGGPPVVAFHCPEQGVRALEAAGAGGPAYPASVLPVPMACLRHVSDADLLTAFRFGAAAVALVGCEACPHGERRLVGERLELVRRVLGAFGLESERVQLVTGPPAQALGMLAAFARSWATAPVGWDGRDGAEAPSQREAVADAIGRLIDVRGREPGRVTVPADAPFATPNVRAAGCTLCRTCVNVCPTHAFRFEENPPALTLRALACVNCGLCATACPESVITLRAELPLERSALAHQVVVQDETLRCARCAVPFGTRRAVEVIERKLFGLAALTDTFSGARRGSLRLCPDCRAVAAMQEMDRGWQP